MRWQYLKGFIMFGLVTAVTARVYYSLRRFMPTNILLDAIHTRRGFKWGVPAMLVAVPYALAAAYCVGLVEAGGSGWLNVLALLFVWNALKFLVAGPIALIRLLRERGHTALVRRRSNRAVRNANIGADRYDAPALSSRLG